MSLFEAQGLYGTKAKPQGHDAKLDSEISALAAKPQVAAKPAFGAMRTLPTFEDAPKAFTRQPPPPVQVVAPVQTAAPIQAAARQPPPPPTLAAVVKPLAPPTPAVVAKPLVPVAVAKPAAAASAKPAAAPAKANGATKRKAVRDADEDEDEDEDEDYQVGDENKSEEKRGEDDVSLSDDDDDEGSGSYTSEEEAEEGDDDDDDEEEEAEQEPVKSKIAENIGKLARTARPTSFKDEGSTSDEEGKKAKRGPTPAEHLLGKETVAAVIAKMKSMSKLADLATDDVFLDLNTVVFGVIAPRDPSMIAKMQGLAGTDDDKATKAAARRFTAMKKLGESVGVKAYNKDDQFAPLALAAANSLPTCMVTKRYNEDTVVCAFAVDPFRTASYDFVVSSLGKIGLWPETAVASPIKSFFGCLLRGKSELPLPDRTTAAAAATTAAAEAAAPIDADEATTSEAPPQQQQWAQPMMQDSNDAYESGVDEEVVVIRSGSVLGAKKSLVGELAATVAATTTSDTTKSDYVSFSLKDDHVVATSSTRRALAHNIEGFLTGARVEAAVVPNSVLKSLFANRLKFQRGYLAFSNRARGDPLQFAFHMFHCSKPYTTEKDAERATQFDAFMKKPIITADEQGARMFAFAFYLFSFVRMSTSLLGTDSVCAPFIDKSRFVVSSDAHSKSTALVLGVNELPSGVFIKLNLRMLELLNKLWLEYLGHLKLPAKPTTSAQYVNARNKALDADAKLATLHAYLTDEGAPKKSGTYDAEELPLFQSVEDSLMTTIDAMFLQMD